MAVDQDHSWVPKKATRETLGHLDLFGICGLVDEMLIRSAASYSTGHLQSSSRWKPDKAAIIKMTLGSVSIKRNQSSLAGDKVIKLHLLNTVEMQREAVTQLRLRQLFFASQTQINNEGS